MPKADAEHLPGVVLTVLQMEYQMYRDLLGVKFKVHGRSKEEGFDCYGLAVEVLRRNGITMKDVFYDDFERRKDVHDTLHCLVKNEKIESLMKNCVIEIDDKGGPFHIGVYIGEGKMIHTVREAGVVIEPVSRYKKRITGLYKIG